MSDFRLRVLGPDRRVGMDLTLECDTKEHALLIAREVRSPFGHELLDGERFLCRFEAAWSAGGLALDDEDISDVL